jgi:4-hydroxy-tetrahydrodipicolinate reductase
MKIGIFGRGRLGFAIANAAGIDVAWQTGRGPAPDMPADVAIDASAGAAVPGHLGWALERGVPLVIGATGWDIPDLAARVGKKIGVVVAPNFSLTVALLARLTGILARYAASDPRFDPYIVEHHQAKKLDAPSGTAKMLARVLMKDCPSKTAVATPHGDAIRPSDLCVASVRAGTTGSNSHTVALESPDEAILVRHEGRGSGAYTAGALAACRFILERRGVFTMDDVAREVLDPLFKPEAP